MESTSPQGTLPPTEPDLETGEPAALDASLTRRGFLRGAALAGTGLVAATVAACAPAAAPSWSYATTKPLPATPIPSSPPSTAPSATPAMSMAPASPTPAPSQPPANIPAGWSEHDVAARNVIRRYVGNLAPALKGIYGDAAFAQLADILGAADNYPELSQPPAFAQVPQVVLSDVVSPLKPTLDGNVKVFELSIDEIEHKIDEKMAPIGALGYSKAWPGPTIRATEGDKLRVKFTNNLKETTGVHFHGIDFADFFQDGVPFVTQKPITPGETYTYEFTASPAGTMMYHSHHNATDQVGRGLLAGFIIDPKDDPDPKKAYEKKYGIGYDREYSWISNDTLGGFTINGHGFPATVPVLAAVGEKVLIRFMNEGIMMHPWHSHGNTMRVVARDGRPLGSASFDCDTLGVNPGERYDAVITAERPGIWAFHCHILPHVEGLDGMFGMVSTLFVVPKASDVTAILKALGIG
jgi:FtsP/CotA-like multicopper oxidase with cupredoxin domain